MRSGSSLHFESRGPIWGDFDASRIDQVLSNLLSNAIRYGRGRPIVVIDEIRLMDYTSASVTGRGWLPSTSANP